MTTGPERLPRTLDDALLVVAAALVTTILFVAPSIAMLLHSGRIYRLSPASVATSWWRVVVDDRWADPASAFPPRSRRLMPASTGWWVSAGYSAAVTGLMLAGVLRWLDRMLSTPTLGRREQALRGARPRSWAKPRDVGSLIVRRRAPDRFMLGTIGRPARLLAARKS